MSPPRSTDETPELPRTQSGANPQHVMAQLLGDFWLDRDEHLPSASLVDLVGEFGVTTASARAALSRLLRRGTLEVQKSGRNTFYRLSPRAHGRLVAARDALVASTRPADVRWDGSWVVVAFSVSEDRREVRHALRSGLRRLRFGPLYDGVWASPVADAVQVTALLTGLEVRQATVLRSSVVHPDGGAGHPASVWNLAELSADYLDFVATHEPVRAAVAAGTVGPADALRARCELIDAWLGLIEREPGLPAELLPQPWPRDRATDVFVSLCNDLAPLAETRFREIVAVEAPGLAPLANAQRPSWRPSEQNDSRGTKQTSSI